MDIPFAVLGGGLRVAAKRLKKSETDRMDIDDLRAAGTRLERAFL